MPSVNKKAKAGRLPWQQSLKEEILMEVSKELNKIKEEFKRNPSAWYDYYLPRAPYYEVRMPKLENVLTEYPMINGVHPALGAYPHINLPYYYDELCVWWKGIRDSIIIDKNGLLVDGRLRLMVEYTFPGESLGEIPIEITDENPWDVVHRLNGRRVAPLLLLDEDQLITYKKWIHHFDYRPYGKLYSHI